MGFKRLSMLACLALLQPTAFAQSADTSETMKKAMVAGYKALASCSATFLAGQTRAEIGANELDGIYADYRPLLSDVSDANIRDRSRSVTVRFDRDLPPRIAKYRPGMGCALLPVGALPSAADWLPGFAAEAPSTGRDVSTALGDAVQITENTLGLGQLEAPVSFAFDGLTYGADTRTSAVLIVQQGQVITEVYDRGINADTPQRAWSVAKSLTATIIGAAIEKGIVGLDTEAILAEWNHGAEPRRDITLRHLLNMTSGLASGPHSARSDDIFAGAKVADLVTAHGLDAIPGERFQYSNIDTLLAMRALREAMDDTGAYHRFPYEAVLRKIGANNTVLETDWHGDYITSSQVWMTARDMARLGQLYLQNGWWGGERILPDGWINFVTTPGQAQPDSDQLEYGGSFWLMTAMDGVPVDTYAGFGARGQYMVIIPSYDLVIVRRGFDVSGGTQFDIGAFVRDIVSVLDRIEAQKLAAELEALGEEAEE